MSNIANTAYARKNVTKDWLNENKFKLNKQYADEAVGNVYTYRFHVFKHRGTATLDCEINYFESINEFNVDVLRNFGEKDKYYPFYYVGFGNYDWILSKINKEINYKLEKLGIVEKNRDTYDG